MHLHGIAQEYRFDTRSDLHLCSGLWSKCRIARNQNEMRPAGGWFAGKACRWYNDRYDQRRNRGICMTKSPATQNTTRWLAIAAVVLGMACTAAGIWVLSWSPGTAETARAKVVFPTSTPLSVSTVTASAPLPTQTPASSPTPFPTATAQATVTPGQATPTPQVVQTPSPGVSTPTPWPTPTAPPDGHLALTIVHSNDTWGYTWPCG